MKLATPALILPDRRIHRCTSEQSWGMLKYGIPGAGAAAMHHGSGVAAVPATIAYGGSAASVSNLSSYTFNTIGIGTASSDRYIAVTTAFRLNFGGEETTALTVAGQSCTRVAFSSSGSGASQAREIWITDAPVTSGTTATIVATLSGSANNYGIGTYGLKGILSATPTATASADTVNASMSLAISAGGVVVAVASMRDDDAAGGTSFTTTGVTRNFTTIVETDSMAMAAGNTSSTSATTASITFTAVNPNNGNYGALCAAFR